MERTRTDGSELGVAAAVWHSVVVYWRKTPTECNGIRVVDGSGEAAEVAVEVQ